jgi:SagB-type dehydrogenase family enzyme
MDNKGTSAAIHYHNGTKHPGGVLMDPRHRYMPGMEPQLQKVYPNQEKIPLEIKPIATQIPAASAIGGSTPETMNATALTLDLLASLLHYSAGVTKRINYPGWGEIPFRAAACTGALYHIELYVVCADLSGLASGVYHFNPLELALTRLRSGDYRAFLAAATGDDSAATQAQAAIIYTDIPAHNAIKYQAREFRHAFWDCGTILANTEALAAAYHLPARLLLGFVDERVNLLLGLDGHSEYALAVFALGTGQNLQGKSAPPVEEIHSPVETSRGRVLDWPAIQAIYQASKLSDPQQVSAWRLSPDETVPGVPESPASGELYHLPTSDNLPPAQSIEAVIQRRGSPRQFSQQPVTLEQLSILLERAFRPIASDFCGRPGAELNQAYLIANAVEDLPSGSYVYHPQEHALELLQAGNLRQIAGFLALGQDLGAEASADLYFLADLEPILNRWGNRGYRAAQMDASLRAGRIYLAAHALGFGATGLTFYDDEVTAFFSPHAATKSVMFLVAAGYRARRRQS